MRVLFWIATFVNPKQISENCVQEFGFPISRTTIWHYANHDNYQKPIARIREKWGQDILKIELAHKRRRLEELSKIYEHTYNRHNYREAMAALYQIQHEVDKDLDKLNVTNMQVNIYKDMTDAELEEERLKSLERLKLLKGELKCLAVEKRNPENQENSEQAEGIPNEQ